MELKPRQFLELVAETASGALDGEKPQIRLRSSLVQLYFESQSQHYEVWLRRPVGLLELGLHFEGPLEENLRRIDCLIESMPEIVGALGPQVDLEEWTATWSRLHEVQPMPSFDDASAIELGHRVATYVKVLEPIIRPLGPMPPAPPVDRSGGKWRHRRK